MNKSIEGIAKELSFEESKNIYEMKLKQKTDSEKAYKDLQKTACLSALEILIEASKTLSKAKTFVYQQSETINEYRKETYQTSEKQRRYSFSCEKGGYTIGYRMVDRWDETVNEGIEKINNALATLAKDESSKLLLEGVKTLMKQNKDGNLRLSSVVQVENQFKGEIKNPDFEEGLRIIRKAHNPTATCFFIEAYQMNAENKKENIDLSISAVNFTEDYAFNGFKLLNH